MHFAQLLVVALALSATLTSAMPPKKADAERTRARRWFVTVDCDAEAAALAQAGNYTELLRQLYEQHQNDVAYVTGVEEVGHENGRHHLHFYLALTRQMDLSRVKALVGLHTAHFDVARGTLAQCVA